MVDADVPWALAIGNHDLEGDLTAEEILELDGSYDLSYTVKGPSYLSHVGNYYIPLTRGDDIRYLLWVMNTGNRHHCEGTHGYD